MAQRSINDIYWFPTHKSSLNNICIYASIILYSVRALSPYCHLSFFNTHFYLSYKDRHSVLNGTKILYPSRELYGLEESFHFPATSPEHHNIHIHIPNIIHYIGITYILPIHLNYNRIYRNKIESLSVYIGIIY